MQLTPSGIEENRSKTGGASPWLAPAFLALLALTGCGGGGGGGGVDSSIANFTNTFNGVDSGNHLISLFLSPDQASTNQHAGSFDATR